MPSSTRVSSAVNGDDGLQLDEQEAGDVTMDAVRSDLGSNGAHSPPPTNEGVSGEGIDVNEAGSGSVRITFDRLETKLNHGDGVDFLEEDGGDLWVRGDRMFPYGNAAAGVVLTERGGGHLDVDIRRLTIKWPGSDGVIATEANDGHLVLTLHQAYIEERTQIGLFLAERGDGDLRGVLASNSAIVRNLIGVIADEDDLGTGTFELLSSHVRASRRSDFILDDVTLLPGS